MQANLFGWIDALAHGAVAQAVLALSLVIALGLAFGSLGVRGVKLGSAGVLFVGLFAGQAGLHIDTSILEFARDFGLILFVYTVGLQVGPSFFSSLKRQGLELNILGVSTVLLGGLIVVGFRFLLGFSLPAAAGLFSGATTNTPSLAAGQAALLTLEHVGEGSSDLLGMAYAIAYPFGVVGIILTMLFMRNAFAAAPEAELETNTKDKAATAATDYIDLEVTNPNLDGLPIRELPFVAQSDVVFSRLYRDGKVVVPEAESVIRVGDSLRLVGVKAKLAEFETVIGEKSEISLSDIPSELTTERVYVTKREVLGKTLRELNFERLYGTVVTRITRAGIEFPAGDQVRLQFGDLLLVVGPTEGVRKVGQITGNKAEALNSPHIVPVFVGIMIGVILGGLPIVIPGMPAPVRLGLAGGPLVVALCLSRIGRVGPLIWYMTPAANLVIREIGITLFLACVGLKSGSRLLEVLLSGSGVSWLLAGAFLTLVPLVIVALAARYWLKIDYPTMCGVLAGSMTDPPALAFATSFTESDQPLTAYAAVYPLVMILRVFIVQILVLTLPM
jgi:putative transport protein